MSVCHEIRMISWHTDIASPGPDAQPVATASLAARSPGPRHRSPAGAGGHAARVGAADAAEIQAGRAAPPGGEPPGGAGDLG